MKLKIDNKIYDIEMYKSPWKRLKGFMFQKEIKKVICFPRCRSIHTFFMKCPIRVIYLDKNRNVLKKIDHLRPNKLSCCRKAYYVLECNTDLLKKNSNIQITRD